MAILNNSNAISSGGYDINNSLRFRASASAYLSRTFTTPTDGKKWTWSGWVKRGILTAGTGTAQQLFSAGSATAFFRFSTTDTLLSGWTGASNLDTTQVFRDPSAWYHIMLVVDTTQATAANRVKYYVNGSQITAFATTDYPTQNSTTTINSAVSHNIAAFTSSTQYFDGYMTEINFVDGQALTPSSFGETSTTTGSWIPKAYTGTFGTNGFYLKFSDIAQTVSSNVGLGKDFSGNANYWVTNNISTTAGVTYDAMIDSPTLTSATVANYAVLNTVYKAQSQPTISNGNLTQTPTTTAYQNAFSTIGVTSGKWYVEITMAGTPNSANYFGIANATQLNYLISNADIPGTTTGTGYVYVALNGQKYTNGGGTAYGAALASGDVLGIAFDADAGTLTFYKNGVSQGTAFTGIDATTTFFFGGTVYTGGVTSVSYNFGQRPFSYTPPTGYKALNTFNLPDSTIVKGNTVMDATLYTGNGSTQTITNTAGFKPDAIWIKTRSAGAFNHHMVDSVRGVTKVLIPNGTGAEVTSTDQVTAINSNGFSLGADTAGPADREVNVSGSTYVGWQWQAGQGSTSSNTSGSITSTVSVNTTAGFSVVTYTGTGSAATVGHGLGVAPKMVIIKNRTAGSTPWNVYQASIPSGNLLALSSAAVSFSSANRITAVSSTTFSLGADSDVNGSTNSHVAYCWAGIAGFSAFGSYTGNGSTNGPFVYLGFRTKFIMFKRTDTASYDWFIYDTARDAYNSTFLVLRSPTNTGNAGTAGIDITANGFKQTQTDPSVNASGGTYIYMAFAENPFKNALAR